MATALMIATTAISTVGTLAGASAEAANYKAEGKAQEAVAEYEASQLRYKAGQERASAQRAAEQERRKGRLAASRARAVAAASGGGATAPTVMDILSTLRGQSEYNAGVAMYEGEETAKGLEAQAENTEAEGKYARAAANYRAKYTKRLGYLNAAGTLVSGGATFYGKYWPEEDTTVAATSYGKQTKIAHPYGWE